MSFLLNIDDSNMDNEIISLITKYENKITEIEPYLEIKGETIMSVNKKLPHYLTNYYQTFNEISALLKFLQNRYEKVYSKYYKKYNENYSAKLSSRDIPIYIDSEKEIVNLKALMLEIDLLKEQYSAIVAGLQQISYTTKNATNLVVADKQDYVF